MGGFFSIIVSLLLGVTNIANPSQSNSPTLLTPPNGKTNICLSQSLLARGIDPGQTKVPRRLSKIIKPNNSNVSPNYLIPECQGKGSCEGPDVADYTLVATNVKVEHVVFPNSFEDGVSLSDRQLVRQTAFTLDTVLADRYKNRIYRTHCGDWCYTCKPEDVICLDVTCLKVECDTKSPAVELPYKGSFHCDFIYFLQDTDSQNRLQIDENGNIPASMVNPKDPNVLVDDTLYSVYFRTGGTFPKDVQCETKNEIPMVTPYNQITVSNDKLEYPPGSKKYWRLVPNPNRADGTYGGRNSQLNSYRLRGKVTNPIKFSGEYELYSNLVDPVSEDYRYLVTAGTIQQMTDMLQKYPPQFGSFSYILLERWDLHTGNQSSLKLGSFPLQADWVKKWVQESKPAIYLYPETETDVTVKLNPLGYLTVSDPPYDPVKGWEIRVKPNGLISAIPNNLKLNTYNLKPNIEYPYLYYEAQLSEIPSPKTGFSVKMNEIEQFLNQKLTFLGLNTKELTDFLEYWMPRLKDTGKPYMFIYFLSEAEIERIEPVEISIPVDSAIRIRPYFRPVDSPIDQPVQELELGLQKRTGNVMVEWGGILDI